MSDVQMPRARYALAIAASAVILVVFLATLAQLLGQPSP